MSPENLSPVQGTGNILIAFSHGPVTNTALVAKFYSLEQLAQRLSVPKIGDKSGSYYIRGGELSEPRRADETLLSGSLIVLDGDSRICPVTGEVQPGAPPFDEVCAALDATARTHRTATDRMRASTNTASFCRQPCQMRQPLTRVSGM
jgi:hypothetical protein